MESVQHEAIATERDDDITVVNGIVPVTLDQISKRRLCINRVTGDECDFLFQTLLPQMSADARNIKYQIFNNFIISC